MKKNDFNNDPNITRRNFLKKLTKTTVFAIPTIQSYNLLAKKGKNEYTAHGHGHGHGMGMGNSLPPPPPPGTSSY